MIKGKILVVDDEKLICWSLKKDLSAEGYEVDTAQTSDEALDAFSRNSYDIVLLDIRLSDEDGMELLRIMRKQDPQIAAIMVTANDDIRTAVLCMQLGAFSYLHKPFKFEELKLNIEKAIESTRLKRRVAQWVSCERGRYDLSSMIADSPKMKPVVRLIQQIIDSEASTVLIQGESGTGKDLVARIIHYGNGRASRSFVSVNCAAIPEALLESELFGHEKGSFTDAKQAKKGLVEEAAGGTLFLDEIGDMPKELQAKLLHLIDQKKYRKVGGVKEFETDVRIIAATNKNLQEEVAQKKFREDLYYRLHVIPVYLPPLRERKEDVPALVSFFIAHFNKEFRKNIEGIAQEAMETLIRYDWPGNIRELRNVIERAMILNKSQMIGPEHLPNEVDCRCALKDEANPCPDAEPSNKVPKCLSGIPLDMIEKHTVLLALEEAGGNQSKAARLLSIGRDALRYKMQKYGLLDSSRASNEELSENTQSPPSSA